MRNMAPQVAVRPRWLADVAHDRFQLELVNAATPRDARGSPMSAADALSHWIATPPTWDDFSWLREQWHGPILAKGIVTGDDARRAIDAGADAIIVSNHGGRQLDSVPAGLPALVEVVDAVGATGRSAGGRRLPAWRRRRRRPSPLGARAAMVGRAVGLRAGRRRPARRRPGPRAFCGRIWTARCGCWAALRSPTSTGATCAFRRTGSEPSADSVRPGG